MATGMRNDLERWLIHHDHTFADVKDAESIFHIAVKDAGQFGVMIDIFEPNAQPGVLVIGAKVPLRNNQIARYNTFGNDEKANFEKKIAEFCHTIQAINRNVTEDGKRKVGIYVVLDDKAGINQQTVFEAINKVAEMYEKTARFLLKTF
ncbi:MAG: DUF2299 family protein [Thaumarchaeota archaeon]|nr:DUF2299 family protein [Nitrososphaerota archaeon]